MTPKNKLILRCAKCNKPVPALVEKLWKTGPQGYRRYPVCLTCAKEIDMQNSQPATTKKVN